MTDSKAVGTSKDSPFSVKANTKDQKLILTLTKRRFCGGDKFQYRFEKRINHSEWLYQVVLKRTIGTHTE